MSDLPRRTIDPEPSYSLDDCLKSPLRNGEFSRVLPLPEDVTLKLPEPVFPSKPELFSAPDEAYFPREGERRWAILQSYQVMRDWMLPSLQSRLQRGEFHPIIAYLFHGWQCNLSCDYCGTCNSRITGMTEDIAKRSIDWLQGTTCRALALVGGEVLLRPQFTHKVIYYAAKQGFWVYLPTNGRLMNQNVIDRVADAGVATVNGPAHYVAAVTVLGLLVILIASVRCPSAAF